MKRNVPFLREFLHHRSSGIERAIESESEYLSEIVKKKNISFVPERDGSMFRYYRYITTALGELYLLSKSTHKLKTVVVVCKSKFIYYRWGLRRKFT